ncbi:MAG: PAC2 family protein [Chloroflexi bacterium]|nr:PAC2 family protein [Chloroflexota bacterium]
MLVARSLPRLRSPVVLCAFSGWPDAGQAASGALEYLIMKWAPRRFAEMDPSRIYVETTNRPTSKITRAGAHRLVWPSFTWYGLPVPYAERDMVLVLGPEPDLRWRTCTNEILDLIERLGSDLIVTLGAYLAPVSHMASVPLSGRGTTPQLRQRLAELGLGDGKYEGPTGFPTALLEAASQRGLPTAALWAASPIYLRGLANAKLSNALLAIVERLLNVELGLTELEVAGRDLERRVESELASRPDLQHFVQRLTGDLEDVLDLDDVPDAEELLEELEQYLEHLGDDEED